MPSQICYLFTIQQATVSIVCYGLCGVHMYMVYVCVRPYVLTHLYTEKGW